MTIRANYARLGAAMIADGVTHAFATRQEESGDRSYVAVVTVNTATGDVRMIGMRRDSE